MLIYTVPVYSPLVHWDLQGREIYSLSTRFLEVICRQQLSKKFGKGDVLPHSTSQDDLQVLLKPTLVITGLTHLFNSQCQSVPSSFTHCSSKAPKSRAQCSPDHLLEQIKQEHPSEGCLGQISIAGQPEELVAPRFPESGSLDLTNMSCYFQIVYSTNYKENLNQT